MKKHSTLIKAAKQIVYCVVLEPDSEDSQGDIISADDIEKAAHEYMANYRQIFDSHVEKTDASPVESFIAPVDMVVQGEHIRKGSWVMAIKVQDASLWAAIEKGEVNGVSIGGYGTREALE